MPWHHATKADLQQSALKDLLEPVKLFTLKSGEHFQTLHTSRMGKVIESWGEEGVKVQLYSVGEGWVEKQLQPLCLVLRR